VTDQHASECHGQTCVTCADVAIPVRVTSLHPGGLAQVDTGSGTEEVSVALVDVQVGDVVLVHAKEAIAVLSPLSPSAEAAPPPEPITRPVTSVASRVETSTPYEQEAAGLTSLYPFLYASGDTSTDDVIADVSRSTAEKAREIVALRERTLRELWPHLTKCADALIEAFRSGGRLFTFGNGGSSTDAQAIAQLFLAPPRVAPNERPYPGLPAMSLTSDAALVTALSNDVGFEVVFARQIAALGSPGDIALALSTSGGSRNVLRGLREARRLGMVTLGLAGSGGGAMAESGLVDHLFVVPSSSVHRIQETQTTLCHVLWELVGQALIETR
jgi:Phosphoheptose isomerase